MRSLKGKKYTTNEKYQKSLVVIYGVGHGSVSLLKPAIQKLRQEDHEFDINLIYIMSPCLEINKLKLKIFNRCKAIEVKWKISIYQIRTGKGILYR